MTDLEIQRVDIAMESVGGSRAQAAAILDMPKKTLSNAILRNKYLRGKWVADGNHNSVAKVPTEAPTYLQTIEIPGPSIPPVTPTEAEAVAIYERENAALRKGYKELGLDEEQTQAAIDATRFYAQHTSHLCDLFGGTLTKHGLRLSLLLSQLEEDIKSKNFRDLYSPDGSLMVRSGEESKFDLFYRGLDQLRKMKELLDTARMNSAKIKMWEASQKHGKGKAGKPGFGLAPLQRQTLVNVQPGATVNLNEQKNGEAATGGIGSAAPNNHD